MSASPKAARKEKGKGKGKGKGKIKAAKGKSVRMSKSKRAGLVIPVSRVSNFLRNGPNARRVSVGAPLAVAAIIEYLTAEMLELAGNVASDFKTSRISPRHIQLAVRSDDELNQLLKSVVIAQGGVVPYIHRSLLSKKNVAKMEIEDEKEKSKTKSKSKSKSRSRSKSKIKSAQQKIKISKQKIKSLNQKIESYRLEIPKQKIP